MAGFSGERTDYLLDTMDHPPLTGDQVYCQVVLRKPALCYVLALTPAGAVEPVSPGENWDQNRPVSRLICPDEGRKRVVLTETGGLYAFIVLVAKGPLQRADCDISSELRERWRRAGADVFWRFDGTNVLAGRATYRLGMTSAPPHPSGLDDLCEFFAHRPGVSACRVLAFPVKKGDKPRSQSSKASAADRKSPNPASP